MILWRPTGLQELLLIHESGWRRWPPRLSHQPIFYPVTTETYAEKIARDWNSVLAAPDNLGFVTRFEIDPATAAKYPVQDAGGVAHRELWVPADDLDRFNDGIVGNIEVIAGFRDGKPLDMNEIRSVWKI